jgi:hypothetical protein
MTVDPFRRALRRSTRLSRPKTGGCEGIAMLNRTNTTLSANLNRLNLVTRSLDRASCVLNGVQTLRVRQDHSSVMRDGMAWSHGSLIPIGRIAIPAIPGSFSVPVQPSVGCVVQARVALARSLSPVDARATSLFTRLAGLDGTILTPTAPLAWPKRSKSERKPVGGKRMYPGHGMADSDRRAPRLAAAIFAASER